MFVENILIGDFLFVQFKTMIIFELECRKDRFALLFC